MSRIWSMPTDAVPVGDGEEIEMDYIEWPPFVVDRQHFKALVAVKDAARELEKLIDIAGTWEKALPEGAEACMRAGDVAVATERLRGNLEYLDEGTRKEPK